MRKQFPVIELPELIEKQCDFSVRIEEINRSISENIEYLKKFISKNH
jgi:hypothetical protein